MADKRTDGSAEQACPVDHASREAWLAQARAQADAAPPHAAQSKDPLGTGRVVSSIPRSSNPGETSCPENHETETGKDKSGRWVYPSEKMFFEAMKRKGMGAKERDMRTVVPIHNAVNEKAWEEIVEWEQPYLGTAYVTFPPPLPTHYL